MVKRMRYLIGLMLALVLLFGMGNFSGVGLSYADDAGDSDSSDPGDSGDHDDNGGGPDTDPTGEGEETGGDD